MTCPTCGQPIPDQAKFCAHCGAKIERPAPQPASSDKTETVIVRPTTAAVKVPRPVKPQGGAVSTPIKPLAPRFKRIIPVVVLIVLAALALIFVLSRLFRDDNAYVYVTDSRYVLISDLDKAETIDIDSNRAEYPLAFFSPDGKYLYYYTRRNGDSKECTLCRAEYGKLKENSAKNDQYITIVSTHVQLFSDINMTSDGGLLYLDTNDTLYFFNGESSEQIARNVSFIQLDEKDRLVYGVLDDNYISMTLYTIDLKDTSSRTRLAKDVYEIYSSKNLDQIVYSFHNGDISTDLYTIGINAESTLVEADIDQVWETEDGTIFYSTESDSLSAYDFVVDDLPTTEPNISDFSVPQYTYYRLNSSSDLSSFNQIYTSCSIWLYFFSEPIRDIAEENTAQGAACAAFVSKYLSQEDENGYIVLTDEIKQDLMTIASTFGQGYENEWQELCIGRRQSGTTTDYDSYSQALKGYELRNELKEESMPLYTLKRLDAEGPVSIVEDVFGCAEYNDTVGYLFFNEGEKFSTLSELTDGSSIESHMADHIESFNYYLYLPAEDRSIRISGDFFTQMIDESDDFYDPYVVGDQLLFDNGDEVICVADIVDNSVESYSILTDAGTILDVVDGKLYYLNDPYTDGDYTMGDLYVYQNGGSQRLLTDVSSLIRVYVDGKIFALSDMHRNSNYETCGDLVMLNAKGEQTSIAYDVSFYTHPDENTVLYISDGDLYSDNGKDRTRIATDVRSVYCKDFVDLTTLY